MAVTKVIELSASSPKGHRGCGAGGPGEGRENGEEHQGACINDIKVATDNGGAVREWRVNMRINFEVD